MIYLGADHRGFNLKEKIKKWLSKWGEEFEDCGNNIFDPEDDFPDFAIKVGEKVAMEKGKGILLCGSGGMALTANKIKGVWAAEAWGVKWARHAKQHDNINVLVIPADSVNNYTAKKMIRVWLDSPLKTEVKYIRRLEKIKKLEDRNFK